jgi:DNA repair protein RadC
MKIQVNEIKVSYKERITSPFWLKINSSKDVAKMLLGTWDKDTIEVYESFKVILLNNANKVKGIYHVSNGGITGTLVDLRILFAVVLKSLAVAIIITHNHPSGTLKVSAADKAITQKIKKAAELLDIKLLDHVIIVPDGNYYSFADEGIL